MARLEGVPKEQVYVVWGEVRKIIRPHIEALETHTICDVLDNLLNRDWQLWLAHDDGIKAVCITQIQVYPRQKRCRIMLVAGEGMDGWLPFEEAIADWARTQGCDKLVGELRKGWQRKLKHWKFMNIVAERKL